MLVRKTSELIKIKVGKLIVKVSPLTRLQKSAVQSKISSGTIEKALEGSYLAMKYAIKDVEGLKLSDGSEYTINKDDAGMITDECLDDLLNIELNDDLQVICGTLVNNIPSEFVDPETGEKIKHINIIESKSKGKK